MRHLAELLIAGYASIIGAIILYYIIRKLVKYADTPDQIQQTTPISEPTLQTQSEHPIANASNYNSRFKNLVLYSGYNTTFTEIDEVIISPYGIFCIEYKAHVGYIFGSRAQTNWTQCKYNGERHKLYNPIHQNYKHVKALEQLLGNKIKVPIHSLVLFTGAKIVKVDSDRVLLGYDQLRDRLSHYATARYSANEYAEICDRLLVSSIESGSRFETHVQELREYIHATVATV